MASRAGLDGPPSLIGEESRTYSFGPVATNTARTLAHGYHLVNRSKGDIKIVEVANLKPCCGDVRAGATSLHPGEETDVWVTIRVAEKLGDVTHETVVVTEPPAPSDIVLRTMARAYSPLRVEELGERPGSIVLDASAVQRWKLRAFAQGSADDPPIDLDRMALASSAKVDWLGPKHAGTGEGGLIVATRDFVLEHYPGVSIGPNAVEIALKGAKGPLIEHSVQWEVLPPITAAPKVVVFSSERRSARFTLRSGDGKAFRVMGVTCTTGGIEANATSTLPGPIQSIDTRLDGQSARGGVRGMISVRTDHPSLGSIDVPFLVLD